MELECIYGNVHTPCNVNHALAFLLTLGLPVLDSRNSSTEKLVFLARKPLEFRGDALAISRFKKDLWELRLHQPVNGAITQRWMEYMSVPAECAAECRALSPDNLMIVWIKSLRQRWPITIVLKMFVT